VPTSVIVNADDFGFSPGVTDAILDSHRRGILTSTTLMCTMPDAARAVSLARQEPKLGVGIHLCLTQGTPLASGLRVLAKPSDAGHPSNLHQSVPALIKKLQFSREARNEARREWEAQIDYAISAGIKPTHLDSHKHIHHWPVLQDIAIDLAKKYRIPAIRCAQEINPGLLRCPMGYRVLARLARQLARKLSQTGIQTTDWFYGLAATGAFSEKHWLELLNRLPSGTGEIMIHPGKMDGLHDTATRLIAQRELEWQGAIAPAVWKAVEQNKIFLISYAAVASKS
jgi:predicted glycoside hydrolase/deacetylase ChbG (UPF0249 family)